MIDIFIMSCFCVGMKIIQEPTMILYKPFQIIKRITPKFLHKPLFDCVYCFSSFYGGIAFWVTQIYSKIDSNEALYFHWSILLKWVLFTVCTVYLNGVLFNGLKHEKG